MPVFPSAEWLDGYVERINSSEEFEDAARTFEADIAFVFEAEPENGVPADIWCLATFGDGKCRQADYDVEQESAAGATFVIRAPYSRWKDVIEGRIDPIEGMLDGDLVVTGHLPTLLRYVRATDELVNLAAKVSSSFVDERR
ncbi:SCP2 sterol-binding domain-containing protein [Micromonospora sp. STR1_7]|uniref:SCP2 sterol-binding domain-containing protein n=1 Tax=Micromonospora parastrephiae TaxID=2806101 RepID=A0ABS1XWE8_9ACTN|nr:SCP2 sterol-binding domain-containing protein [Micromonospora parastrephiae]MBM0233570.1 SCP2 sterol-binding domain-containing protein [Micromonospora parastrephiae]